MVNLFPEEKRSHLTQEMMEVRHFATDLETREEVVEEYAENGTGEHCTKKKCSHYQHSFHRSCCSLTLILQQDWADTCLSSRMRKYTFPVQQLLGWEDRGPPVQEENT